MQFLRQGEYLSSCLARPGEDRRRRRNAHRQWPLDLRVPRRAAHICVISVDQRQQTPPGEGIGPLGQARTRCACSLQKSSSIRPPLTHAKLQPNSIEAASTRLPASRPHLSSLGPRRKTPLQCVRRSSIRRCSSNPRLPGEMRANAIRCLQTGHIGRSVKDAVIPGPRSKIIRFLERESAKFAIGRTLRSNLLVDTCRTGAAFMLWRLSDARSLREAIECRFDEMSFRMMPKSANGLLPSAQETAR